MARDGVAVDAEFAGLVARVAAGERLNVAAACRELGVSREMFYKYLARFRREGVDGLFPRSRARLTQQSKAASDVEDAIVLARKQLEERGLDNGAQSIMWWLHDHPESWQGDPSRSGSVPSRATVNRILRDRGQIRPMPQRRPLRSRRFVRPAANDLWQMDGYEFHLADGSRAVVIELVDDHSRLNLAAHAATSENGDDAWLAFCAAADRYGLPYQLLTDNGSAFSGRRRGWTTALESRLHDLGVATICSSVAHPQTCGKVERGHLTARKWLAKQPPAVSLAALQQQLEAYRQVFNHERRHQSLPALTPAQAWELAPRSGPAGQPLRERLHVTECRVSPSGCIGVQDTEIGLGKRFTGATTTVFRTGDQVSVFVGDVLIRRLTLDRTKRYQPQT